VGLRSSLDTEVTGKILGLGVGSGFIALMMEAICASETSVYSNETTRHYIPEDSKLQKVSFLFKNIQGCHSTLEQLNHHLQYSPTCTLTYTTSPETR
jgi:tRNA1(Val) A37 N6-methylase TrmN6